MAHALVSRPPESGLNPSEAIAQAGSFPAHEHRPDIDGLRAIAILGVLAVHSIARLLPGGFAGVDIFFVISGYLITGIILRDFYRGNFSLTGFYIRRVRRLFPALAVVLLCTLMVGWLLLLPREFKDLGRQVLSGAGFALNLVLYNDGGYQTSVLLQHLWSLGVEEQFYLVWPLYVLAVLSLRGGRLFVPATVTLTVVSLVACGVLATWDPQASFFLPVSRLWQLSIGGLVAAAELPQTRTLFRGIARFRLPQEISMRCRAWMGLVGAVAIAGSYGLLNGRMKYPGWLAVLPVLGAVLLISAGPVSWINRRLLSHRMMVGIGLISYPLYLWHFPVLVYLYLLTGPQRPPALAILAAIAGAFLLAWLTFKYVELPVRRSAKVRDTSVILCAIMGCIALMAFGVFTQRITTRAVTRDVHQLQQAMTEDWLPGTSVYWTAYTGQPITLGNGPRTALFIGDHHMQQYFPRINKLLPDFSASLTAVFVTRSGCPPVAEMQSSAQFGGACAALLEDAVRQASKPTVDLVVIGYCWECYFSSEAPVADAFSSELKSLEALMSRLSIGGKRAYLILGGPTGTAFDPRWMVKRRVLDAHSRLKGEPIERSAVERRVIEINERLAEIAKRAGYRVIRPMNYLCGPNVCETTLPSGEPVFHDALNLTASYVEQQATFIDEVIRPPTGAMSADLR
jgi:peptidoglycan/LPS O-acetylase OafA/YrhL